MATDTEETAGEGAGDAVAPETPMHSGVIKTVGTRGAADIPERIVKKLARIAGLTYSDKAPAGGGGLCLGIEGIKRRKKALMILGAMVGQIGKSSMNVAVEGAGASWLDVVGWREDVEYSLLWAAAVRVRREVAAARLEDDLWDRSLNGYEIDEVRGGVHVSLKKFDNNLGVNLLKGLGYVGKDSGVKSIKIVKGKEVAKAAPGVDGAPEPEKELGDNVDTVMFADRATAFAAMAKAAPGGTGGGK